MLYCGLGRPQTERNEQSNRGDCKMNEWWDKRYINRMAYGKAYEEVYAALQNVKKSLN